MIIGLPKEVKIFEFRVALTPGVVRQLCQSGATLLVEAGAGKGAGFSDKMFREAGAKIVSRDILYRRADMIVKVKEPQPSEYRFFRPGLVYFCFLHLAADLRLLRELKKKKISAIAFETVEAEPRNLPILAPMSEIAGSLAAMIGANYLRKDLGGKGALLTSIGNGGTGHATVIGAGHVGSRAIAMAHGLGGSVSVYDVNPQRLKELQALYPERLQAVSDPNDLPEIIERTDLLIGAVLIPGKKAPAVISRKMVASMEKGSVIVDVAVDQGGCIETIHPTTLKNPVYEKYGILHYGVTNMPSLVPRTATEALSAALLPYLLDMLRQGVEKSMALNPGFAKGLNVHQGQIFHPALQ